MAYFMLYNSVHVKQTTENPGSSLSFNRSIHYVLLRHSEMYNRKWILQILFHCFMSYVDALGCFVLLWIQFWGNFP